jgi:hypothetical protein
MRKFLLLGLLVASFANASTSIHTCSSYTLYQGTGNGDYQKVNDSSDQAHIIQITVTEPVIEVQVNDTDLPVTQFWKDYNVYRNDTGTIEQAGTMFTMKTAIPKGGVYIPVKIVYHCN